MSVTTKEPKISSILLILILMLVFPSFLHHKFHTLHIGNLALYKSPRAFIIIYHLFFLFCLPLMSEIIERIKKISPLTSSLFQSFYSNVAVSGLIVWLSVSLPLLSPIRTRVHYYIASSNRNISLLWQIKINFLWHFPSHCRISINTQLMVRSLLAGTFLIYFYTKGRIYSF